MAEYEHHEQPFAPVFDENSKVLILGTFPSVKSRANNFLLWSSAEQILESACRFMWRVSAADGGRKKVLSAAPSDCHLGCD